MSDDRRTRNRCPSCGGPMRLGQNQDMERDLKCRNSLCKFNFANETCPRCSSSGAKPLDRLAGGFVQLSCGDCQHVWQIPQA